MSEQSNNIDKGKISKLEEQLNCLKRQNSELQNAKLDAMSMGNHEGLSVKQESGQFQYKSVLMNQISNGNIQGDSGPSPAKSRATSPFKTKTLFASAQKYEQTSNISDYAKKYKTTTFLGEKQSSSQMVKFTQPPPIPE